MNKPPAFQFYVSEYLSSLDVRTMTREQELAYLRLLIHQWDAADCRLPDNPKILAVIARMTEEEWLTDGLQVAKKFKRKGGKFFNEKLLRQHCALIAYRRACRKGGVKGMSNRWNGKNIRDNSPYNSTNKDPITTFIRSDNTLSLSLTPTQTTAQQTPTTDKKQQQQNRKTDQRTQTASDLSAAAAAAAATTDQQPAVNIDAIAVKPMRRFLEQLGFPPKMALDWSVSATPHQLWAAAKASRTKDNPNGYMRTMLEKGHSLPCLSGVERSELETYLRENRT